MAEPKETVYSADPHTTAKHRILEEYLKRWLPILANHSKSIRANGRLLYVDGFAGTGEYSDNVPGSPLVAIRTALQHCQSFSVPVQIKLIERDSDRVTHLRKIVTEYRVAMPPSLIMDDPIEGDCESEILKLIEEHERTRRKLGPALFFLDQFGYSSFSMNLIGRILRNDVCEVFSYLNWNLLHPFMTDDTKWAGFTKAFGGEEWKQVLGLSGQQKEDRFRKLYLNALLTHGGAKYAFPFAMRDYKDRVIYWLFFCSNNLRGLEAMKTAMWTVDPSGGFEFSDKHAEMAGKLFSSYSEDALVADLTARLDGREMTVGEIHEHVLVNTPAHKYKSALQKMEKLGSLEVVNPPQGRRAGTFPKDEMRVRITRAVKQQAVKQQEMLF